MSQNEPVPDFIDPGDLLPEDEGTSQASPAPIVRDIDSDSEEVIDDELVEEEAEQSYDEGFEDALALSSELTKVNTDSVLEKREDTRRRLALVYTILTFTVFIIGMGIAVLDGILRDVSIVQNLSEVVPLISGVFLGSLGFVLGYYFRGEDDSSK